VAIRILEPYRRSIGLPVDCHDLNLMGLQILESLVDSRHREAEQDVRRGVDLPLLFQEQVGAILGQPEDVELSLRGCGCGKTQELAVLSE
jgi:hypothetical protein